MKNLRYSLAVIAITALLTTGSTSCKDKNRQSGDQTTNTSDTTRSAPVEVSSDDSLRNGVRDATKDYPTVNATVENGEVTLTGTLERDRLQKLMQSIQSLNPKKVNNQLTLK